MASMKAYCPWLTEADHFMKSPEKILSYLKAAQLWFLQNECVCNSPMADTSCLQTWTGYVVPNAFKYQHNEQPSWNEYKLIVF